MAPMCIGAVLQGVFHRLCSLVLLRCSLMCTLVNVYHKCEASRNVFFLNNASTDKVRLIEVHAL